MKAMINKWTILILLAISVSSIYALNEGRDKTKSFSVKKGEKLIADINQGDIKIRTWDKDEVLIQARGLDPEESGNLVYEYENRVVSIRNDEDYESEELTLQVTVPVQFNLELRTRSGNISVTGEVDGNVIANSSGGDLRFKSIKGDLRAETYGGNIEISGMVEGILDVNTMGGDIRIGTINGKHAKVNTMGGEIFIEKSSSGIIAKTSGGDITVGDAGGDSEFITYGGNVSAGTVSGNVRLETSGGNLDLLGANGKVKAKTSGGNVDFKNIKGSVDVKTAAGEVAVELDPAMGSESRIATSAGAIELTIPASAKVTIEARIHVQGWWKNAKENFKIQSDFDQEDYRSDNENHEIVGTYVLNGGGSKILLRSVNDVIVIKKK